MALFVCWRSFAYRKLSVIFHYVLIRVYSAELLVKTSGGHWLPTITEYDACLQSFLNPALAVGEWLAYHPAGLTLAERTLAVPTEWLAGPQRRSGRFEEGEIHCLLPGFEARAIQP